MSKNIRTRFAPSPTGYLHIGGLRTALFNYLFAKKHEGDFILRIEDTDRERLVEDGVEQIIKSLNWAGITADEGPMLNGDEHGAYGPYAQSERKAKLASYRARAQALLDSGIAYYSHSSPEELTQLRQDAQAKKQPFIYRKRMEPADKREGDHPIRIDIVKFQELLKKESEHFFKKDGEWCVRWNEPNGWSMDAWSIGGVDDFIILKADGYPTYNFANIVDDYEMEISHVLRGDEFVSSTAKHIILYYALGFEDKMPQFQHLPPINGPDGKKLSKRTGDTNALDYQDKGYLPEALISSLALLGWNDGTTQEIYSLQELIAGFSLERIQKSPAVFDIERLTWVNGTLIRKLSLAELSQKATNFWPASAANFDETYRKNVLSLIQERLKFLSEIPELTYFFFEEPTETYRPKADERTWLTRAIETLESSDFTLEDLEHKLRELADTLDIKPGKLFMPIRQALTGSKVSPGLFETLNLLGKETSIARLQTSLDTNQ